MAKKIKKKAIEELPVVKEQQMQGRPNSVPYDVTKKISVSPYYLSFMTSYNDKYDETYYSGSDGKVAKKEAFKTAKKGKGKAKKANSKGSASKRLILICIVLILVLAIAFGSYYYFFYLRNTNSTSPPLDEDALSVYMAGEYYLGTMAFSSGLTTTSTFSLEDFFDFYDTNNVTYTSLNSGIATIEGNVITVLQEGDLEISILNNQSQTTEQKTIFVIEGVNVTSYEELFYAVEEHHSVVLHQNIDLLDPREGDYLIEASNEKELHLYASLYGNGFIIYCEDVLLNDSHNDSAFKVKGNDVIIRDTHFIGTILGEESTLQDLEKTGNIIDVTGEIDHPVSGTLIENCILENAHKLVNINYTDITIRGCILRNSSDANVSVNTNNKGTSNIVIENCVMANAVVACIVFHCQQNIVDEANFVTITFVGFFDVYNWKDVDNARIMPGTEDLEPIVSPIINQYINSGQYSDYYYNYKEKSYIHSAMLIISTPPSQGNYPIINGLDGINFVQRDFPFPNFAKQWIRTCSLCGYEFEADIEPDEKIIDNPNLYEELRNGRN